MKQYDALAYIICTAHGCAVHERDL